MCAECPKKFKKSDLLEMHQKRKHKPRSHICDVCGKHFDNVHYITLHKKMVHYENYENETLPCDTCEKVFVNKYKLKSHKRTCHRDDVDHQCSLCGIKMRMANYKVNILILILYMY